MKDIIDLSKENKENIWRVLPNFAPRALEKKKIIREILC